MFVEFTLFDGRTTYINADKVTQVAESQNKQPFGNNGYYIYTYITIAGDTEATGVREPSNIVLERLNRATS